MPRKKNVIAAEARGLDKLQAEREAADRLYGDGFPFEQSRVEARIKARNANTAEIMLLNGKDHRWMKEYLNHGEFIAAVERTGVSRTWAYYCMRTIEMFSNVHSVNISDFNYQQVRALTVLDKPIVEEFLNGGDLGDIPHDDVSKMSGPELEKETRRLRKLLDEKTKSLEGIIRQKSSKIDELEYEVRTGDQLTKEKKAEKALQKYRDPIIDSIHDATERINRATAAIDEAQKIPHVPFDALEKLIEPWKKSFDVFLEAAEDFSDAFRNIHVDKSRG